jgi:hypothetical protein
MINPNKLSGYFRNRPNFSGQNVNIDIRVDPDRALTEAKREPTRAGKITVSSVSPIENTFSCTLDRRMIIHSISNIKPINFNDYTLEHEMLVRTTLPLYDYVDRVNNHAKINLATGIFITRDGMLHQMSTCGKKIDIMTVMPLVEPALSHNNIMEGDCTYTDADDEAYMEKLIMRSIGWAAYVGPDALFLDILGTRSAHRNPYHICLKYVEKAVKKYAHYFEEIVISCMHEPMMANVQALFKSGGPDT